MATFFPSYEEIRNLRVEPEAGELYIIEYLKNNLDDSFEIFFNPFLNGDRPDIIIMKKNQGVLIIEVKDYVLSKYRLDDRKNWMLNSNNQKIKSPIQQVIKYKENIFDLHIDKLLLKKISDIKNFNVVNCALYFHNSNENELDNFLIKPYRNDKKYINFINFNINLLGRDNLNNFDINKLLKKCFLMSNYPSEYFSDDMYESFKRFLDPPYHFKEQVKQEIPYNQKQLEIIYNCKERKEQRIKGVVGSGKTTVLAARAVQAHKRTNSTVLILSYNITLKNYIRDRISLVKENFNINRFIILKGLRKQTGLTEAVDEIL